MRDPMRFSEREARLRGTILNRPCWTGIELSGSSGGCDHAAF
jgi:hypothetical protein